jgi:hypothetical protein
LRNVVGRVESSWRPARAEGHGDLYEQSHGAVRLAIRAGEREIGSLACDRSSGGGSD